MTLMELILTVRCWSKKVRAVGWRAKVTRTNKFTRMYNEVCDRVIRIVIRESYIGLMLQIGRSNIR